MATRREAFSWLTVLFTFALGTSAGDLTAERLSVGYWQSVVLFAATWIAHVRFRTTCGVQVTCKDHPSDLWYRASRRPSVHAAVPERGGRPDVSSTRRETTDRALLPIVAKVPEITALFWVLKVLTTGMGEAISDYLGHVSIVLAAAVGLVGIAVALRLQFRERVYRAPVYWLAVLMIAVFGTMVADGIRTGLHAPYAVTTVLYAGGTAAVFALWYRSERTLSIHSITTRRRECFYWTAVLGTFALGTAAGDLTASQLKLGYLGSIALFAVAISLPAIGWLRGRLGSIAAFWSAYVLTRPLGASVADWLGKPRKLHSLKGGLALGDGTVGAAALVVFVLLVAYVAVAKPDVQRVAEPVSRAGRAPVEPAIEGAPS